MMSRPTVATSLAQYELFADLPPDCLERLAIFGVFQTFPAGTALVREGDASECVYVVTRGCVRIQTPLPGGPLTTSAEVGQGSVVGVSGLLEGGRRVETVTTVEETETLRLSYDVLAVVMLQQPDAQGAFSRSLRQCAHPRR